MNTSELRLLVAKIAIIDNRKVDGLVLDEWFEDVGDLDFGLSIEAVKRHRRDSTEYLTPAHVRLGVEQIQKENRPARPPIRQRELSPQMQAAYDRAGSSESWSQDANKIGAKISAAPNEGSPMELPVLRSPDE